MCYCNCLSIDATTLANRFNLKTIDPETYKPIYAGKAFNFMAWPVITSSEPTIVRQFRWGLIPFWAKTREIADKIKIGTINARSETAFEKPSFRESIQKRRCLVPSTGFFEWRSFKSKKYPYFITLTDADVFSIAGIWDSWTDKQTGEVQQTFSILTVAANPLMEKIHNEKKRMPVILPVDREKSWLQESLSKEDILALCKPFDENLMKAHTVSRLITSRTDNPNVPEVQKEFEYPELEPLFQ